MVEKNLKLIRERKGYSKRYLAKISGISRKTIEFMENKTASNAKLSTIEALAKALDVSVNDLLK
jgi:DNA-binding Xre family transcriptional regulator